MSLASFSTFTSYSRYQDFILITEWYSIVYIPHSHHIYHFTLVDRCLDYFSLLASESNAIIKIGVQVTLLSPYFQLFGLYTWVWNCCLIYILICNVEGFQWFPSYQYVVFIICLVCVLPFQADMKWYLNVFGICVMTNDAECLFKCHYDIFLEKCVFCPFVLF